LTSQIGPPLSKLQQKGDLVFLSQLGTQTEHPFTCDTRDSLEMLFAVPDQQTIKECLPNGSFYPEDYSTQNAAKHLEILRQEMGHEKIILFGVSYGTRLAQEYMRTFPNHVAYAILDGVLPLDIPLGENISRDTEASLQHLLEDCKNHPSCNETFPQISDDLESLITELQTPKVISIKNPKTGLPVELAMTEEGFLSGLRTLLYSADLRSLLPLTIKGAQQNDWNSFVAQVSSVSSGSNVSLGLYLTITCSEDAPYISKPAEAKRFDVYDDIQKNCALWPSYPFSPKQREPLRSSIPTLLLSGAFDPVTPHSNAQHLAKTLSEATLVEYKGQGHNVSLLPCSLSLIESFIEDGHIENSDCAQSSIPYFVRPSGPEATP
ncbi:MAG: alpha/beta hydrolase, partial [Myxococcota bacterium]|nr:alpha/beta hydrolase [Myxococcota bacterium]